MSAQPFNLEAEMGFLGSCVLHPSEEKFSFLPVETLWRPAHRTIFEALKRLHGRATAVDILTLRDELQSKNQLQDVGGIEYVLEIAEYVPSASNWRDYAAIVLEKAERRAYLEKLSTMKRLIDDGAEIDEIRALDAQACTVGNIPNAPIISIADIFLPDEDEELGLSTGFETLDGLISTKGYPLGQTTIVCAYHKGGKSTFMLSSFAHLAQQGKRVLYATFADLNSVRLKRRLLRNLTGWSKLPMRDMFAQDDWREAVADIDLCWQAWMYDATKMRTGGDVETFCRWLESAHSRYRFDAVFVDYAQKLTSSSRKASTTTAEQDVCSTELNRCAERTGIPIIVGSQITEGNGDKKDTTKGSRKWEEDAGWVLRIKDDEGETATKTIEIAWSRFGAQKVKRTFGWNIERLRFEDRMAEDSRDQD